jgi:glycosyltransferase involved in cell wall biosynthesis
MNTLKKLVQRIKIVMITANLPFELILVDDGSQDGSFDEIKRLSKLHSFITGIRLSRNFGQQAAIFMGLESSKGEFIAIIDDDLQDPPELLPDFFQRLYQEADVVYGVRRERKEKFIEKFFYKAFYYILRKLSKIEIPVNAGDFCVMKRQVVDNMIRFQEANPFLRGIRAWVGFKQIGIEYQRSARLQGKSGYTFKKYFKFALSGILSFSYIPLRISFFLGIISALLCFGFGLYVILLWSLRPFDVPGYASLIIIITFMGSIQMITIGILGEYLTRLNENIRKWPIAVIAETTSVNTPG